MACEGLPDESYNVVVRFPKSLGRRCGDSWNACASRSGRWLGSCLAYCCYLFVWLVALGILFVVVGLVWVLIMCQGSPGLSLEAMAIRDMAVYRNDAIAAPGSPWQVDSRFAVRLSAWNPNTVAGCFCTFRRVRVRVEYRGQVIVQQLVPLGFGLKPRRSRAVPLELQGAHFQLTNADLGPFMQNELRSTNVTVEFFFDVRYLRNDRKGGWLNMGCHVVATPPSTNSTLAGATSLLSQDCVGY